MGDNRTDITDIVQQYRLVLRDIWNLCFWSDPSRRDWDSVKCFDALKRPLFLSLVADRLDSPVLPPCQDEIFGSNFEVVANVPSQDGRVLASLYVDIGFKNAPSGTGKCWDQIAGPINANELKLVLRDFYDWSPLGYRDFRYYLVQIESFRGHENLVGREALVDVAEAEVLWSSGHDNQRT